MNEVTKSEGHKEFTQEKAKLKTGFVFGESRLTYYVKDDSSESTTKIPYTEITSRRWTQRFEKTWYRNVGYLWLIIGLIIEVLPLVNGSPWRLPLFTLLGAGCLGYYYYTLVNTTVLEAGKDNIIVIQDNNHDEIVGELKLRRKDELAKIYNHLNEDNDLDNELKKFNFLLEEEIITQDEFENVKTQILKLKSERGIKSTYYLQK